MVPKIYRDLYALEIPTGNKHLNSRKIRYDILHMRSKACPTITCLCNWIIHIHIVTSHYNQLSVFKIHHKEFSISFKCYSFKFVCSNLSTIVGLRIITYMCAVFTLYSRFVSTSSTQIVPEGKYKAGK